MFRRFFKRRALRVIEKNKKLQQQSKRPEATSQRSTDTIFRSIDSTITFQNIPFARTAASSFGGDGDDNEEENRCVPTAPSTTSPDKNTTSSISCTSFAKGILVDGDVDINENVQPQKERMVVDTSDPEELQRIVASSVDNTSDIIPTTHQHTRSSSCTNSTDRKSVV